MQCNTKTLCQMSASDHFTSGFVTTTLYVCMYEHSSHVSAPPPVTFLSCFRPTSRHMPHYFNKTVEILTVHTTQIPPYFTWRRVFWWNLTILLNYLLLVSHRIVLRYFGEFGQHYAVTFHLTAQRYTAGHGPSVYVRQLYGTMLVKFQTIRINLKAFRQSSVGPYVCLSRLVRKTHLAGWVVTVQCGRLSYCQRATQLQEQAGVCTEENG